MPDKGVRLQLYVGPTIPAPAHFDVMDSLISLEVRNNDSERDGFQLSFSLSKEKMLDYGLFLRHYFDPPARVIIAVTMGVLPQVLIDGIITNHQLSPSDKPGNSTLAVTGEDISLKLDLIDQDHKYPDRSDSAIVEEILKEYIVPLGLTLKITPTNDVPNQNDRVSTYQGTDLEFIQELAQRNSFVFYIQPTRVPGANIAYWGTENRFGDPQPALSMDMGPETNVESLSLSFNALGPETPEVSILIPFTKLPLRIPVPSTSQRPRLALRPALSLRRRLLRDTANKTAPEATQEARSKVDSTSDAVTGNGTLDVVRYGQPLRARGLVGVRGVGFSYNGLYYVKQVTHNIKPGEYKQSFTLAREGLGARTPLVKP